MSRGRRLLALIGVLTLSLGLTAALSASAEAKKKKKAPKTKVFSQQLSVNGSIPEAAAGTVSTPLTSSINVGKKFKGKVVGDVNVTALQTTGSAPGAANDLRAYLTAPSGKTLQIFYQVGDQSLGPWTLDDDSPVSICNAPPAAPCPDPSQSLHQPFGGTSNLTYNWAGFFPENGALSISNGVAMRGTWTLTLVDIAPPGAGNGTSVLNQWGLQITPAKPVRA